MCHSLIWVVAIQSVASSGTRGCDMALAQTGMEQSKSDKMSVGRFMLHLWIGAYLVLPVRSRWDSTAFAPWWVGV